MSVIGKMMLSTDLEKRPGKMALPTMEIGQWARNREKGHSLSQIMVSTRVNSKMTIFTVRVNSLGMMEECMKGSGLIMLFTVMACSPGLMDDFIRELTKMTKSMGMESLGSLMAANMKEIGKTESNTARGNSSRKMEKPRKEPGKMESLWNGLTVNEIQE